MDISYNFLSNEQNIYYAKNNITQKNLLDYSSQSDKSIYDFKKFNSTNEYKGLSLFPKKNYQKNDNYKKPNQNLENFENKKKNKNKRNKKNEIKNEIKKEKRYNKSNENEKENKCEKMKKENKKGNLNNSNYTIDNNVSNINQKSFNLKNSPKLSLFKENESEDTTSFTTNNNLSPSENNSFSNNHVDFNGKFFFKNKISNSVENIFNLKTDINSNDNFNKTNNLGNIIIFPHQSQKEKKKKKKNKKKNKNKVKNSFSKNDINVESNENNNVENLYLDYLSKINIQNLYPDYSLYNNYYNIESIQKYNNKEKTVNNIENYIEKNNYYNQFSNNNDINQQKQFININNNNCLKNNNIETSENKKKYIYMRDIIVNYPKIINPKKFKPFIMKKPIEKEIILNLKIKIDDKGNEIEIGIREGEDPLNVLENIITQIKVKKEKIKRLYNEVQNSLNFVNNFKNILIRNDSLKIINEVNNCLNRNYYKSNSNNKKIIYYSKENSDF